MYVPAQADATGWGSDVRREVEAWIARESAQADDWLAAHPPVIEWWPNSVMPFAIDSSRADRRELVGAGADLGLSGGLGRP